MLNYNHIGSLPPFNSEEDNEDETDTDETNDQNVTWLFFFLSYQHPTKNPLTNITMSSFTNLVTTYFENTVLRLIKHAFVIQASLQQLIILVFFLD